MESEEFEKLMSSIKRENQLQQRIKELIQYRKNGVTKYDGEYL